MARFPKREPEIKSLAQTMVTGLAAQDGGAPVFPSPPVIPMALQTMLDSLIAADDAQVAAQAAAEQATQAKQEALEILVGAMKADLRYAEDWVRRDDAKLSLLGWGSKTAPTALEPPGQPRTLEAPRQGEGWIFLDWKPPVEGGMVAAYKIERRERPAGNWMLAALAIESEATLNNQERGKDWEYRILATNKAGESEPSNTIAAVL
jgi:hypothetical protein